MSIDHDQFWPIVERTPPVPVLLDLSTLFASPVGQRDPVTLGHRAYGFTVEGYRHPGRLVRWVRTSTNAWLGHCEFELRSPNGLATFRALQLLPAKFISRQGHNDESGPPTSR